MQSHKSFYAGDVVWFKFPNADLSEAKIRPAVVLTVLPRGDIVTAMITSKIHISTFNVLTNLDECVNAGLKQLSVVRCSRLFTASTCVVETKSGRFSLYFMRKVYKTAMHAVTAIN